jgi:hypothetical protein
VSVRPTTVPRFNGPGEPARTVGFGKRVPGFGKTGGQTVQGGAGGRAVREGQEPNKE